MKETSWNAVRSPKRLVRWSTIKAGGAADGSSPRAPVIVSTMLGEPVEGAYPSYWSWLTVRLGGLIAGVVSRGVGHAFRLTDDDVQKETLVAADHPQAGRTRGEEKRVG